MIIYSLHFVFYTDFQILMTYIISQCEKIIIPMNDNVVMHNGTEIFRPELFRKGFGNKRINILQSTIHFL